MENNIPAHVLSIKDGLLDFNNFIGLRASMLLSKYGVDDIPLSAYKTDGQTKLEQFREGKLVESAQRLVASAEVVDAENAQEWHRVFREVMADRLNSARNSSNAFESIAWTEDLHITTTDSELAIPPIVPSSASFCFGFPIPESDQNAGKGFRKDPSFDNYNREFLDNLQARGLQYKLPGEPPAENINLHADRKEVPSQTVCFPWGILQVNADHGWHHSNTISSANTLCQVSATASASLSIYERLASFADEKHDTQHIPPVIVITSTGASTTIWLGYCNIIDAEIRDHDMTSIWEGSIADIWDALQFCRIIDNLFFWAQHCLKPLTTQYLNQWRMRYSFESPNVYSRLEADAATANVLHRIQDRLSALGLSINENLPELICQAVVFQEVMGLGSKDFESNQIPQQEKEVLAAIISPPSALTENNLDADLRRVKKPSKETRPNETDIKNSTEILKGIQRLNLKQHSGIKANEKTRRESGMSQRPKLEEPTRECQVPALSKESSAIQMGFNQRMLLSMHSRVENGHVLSLERQKYRKAIQPKVGNGLNSSGSSRLSPGKGKHSEKKQSFARPSSAPHCFTSDSFECRFKTTPWLELELPTEKFTNIVVHRHGPYPLLHIGAIDHEEYPRRDPLPVNIVSGYPLVKQRRLIPESSLPPSPPVSPPRVKVPWKDNKHIIVKLPPVELRKNVNQQTQTPLVKISGPS